MPGKKVLLSVRVLIQSLVRASRQGPWGPVTMRIDMRRTALAVTLRLKRFGRRGRAFFRLNAVDSRRPRDGRVLEELGWYDPLAKTPDRQVSLNRERIEYWLGVGAQPSDTVCDLLKRHGIVVKR